MGPVFIPQAYGRHPSVAGIVVAMDDHRAWPASVRARLIRWAPAVGWMTVIFVLSAQPGLRVAEDPMLDYVLRKVGHVAVFAVLAMLLPGTDPITMLISMLPLVLLFEFSLILARAMGTPGEEEPLTEGVGPDEEEQEEREEPDAAPSEPRPPPPSDH